MNARRGRQGKAAGTAAPHGWVPAGGVVSLLGRWLVLAWLVVCLPGLASAQQNEVRIGVLAHPDVEQALRRWLPTAAYLSRRIPEHVFTVLPLDREGTDAALASGSIDFLITDPGQYVLLEQRRGVRSILTLRRRTSHMHGAWFGAVLLSGADRVGPMSARGLRSLRLLAPEFPGLGAHRVLEGRLTMLGQSGEARGFREILWYRGDPRAALDTLLRGEADVALLRTDELERLTLIEPGLQDQLRVVLPMPGEESELRTSSLLYPEWPLAVMPATPAGLADRVAGVLLQLSADSEAARTGDYAGWTTGLDYRPVRSLYQHLGLLPRTESSDQPWWVAVILMLVLIALSIMAGILLRSFRRSSRLQRALRHEVEARSQIKRELEDIFDAAPALIAYKDREHRVVRINRPAALALGRAPEDILGRPLPEFLPNVAEWDRQTDREVMRSGESRFGLMLPINTISGDSRWLRVDKVPFRDPHGAINGVITFAVDMTEQRAMEVRLRQSEARLRTIIANDPHSIQLLARDGSVLEINPAGLALLEETSRDDVVGRSIYNFLEPDYHSAYKAAISSVFQGRTDVRELRIVTSVGQHRWLEAHSVPLLDDSGQVTELLTIGKDITDRKLGEAREQEHQLELAHAWRVSTMGEMASGIAHEINQPLTAITNYAQGSVRRLQAEPVDVEPLAVAMGEIQSQARRAGEIIQRLRDFVRKGDSMRKRADINSIVEEATVLADIEARNDGIRVQRELQEGLPEILADRVQVEQVVLNLLRNAREAVRESGVNEPHLTVRTQAHGEGGVLVAVQDNGPGLTREARERVFHPFYSTKAEGMGIGLSLSQTIIESHGGRLWVESEERQGAKFFFSLPDARGEQANG